MLGALSGFAVIWSVVALGWVLAHRAVLGSSGQALLNRLAFVAASPALLYSLVAKASLGHLFSRTLIASVVAIGATIAVYVLAQRVLFRHTLSGVTIGWMASAYTNAGNLGLPIAQHVLGDMAWMAPILLVQVALLQPFALACLDAEAARRDGRRLTGVAYLTLPVRNPLTVAILLGVASNVSGLLPPDWLWSAITMVGGTAVPLMLLAFGVSLRLDALPGRGPHAREVWLIQVLKLIVMPGVALIAGLLIGLDRPQLLAVGVIAALPCAQNVFVISTRYRESMPIARDAVFWSTILTVPVIVALSATLG